MFENINELLQIARSREASDLHITVGVPPKIRVDGVLESIGEEKIMPADAERLVWEIIPERLKEQFAEKGEIDFSHAITGVGRFRVNAFRQRGSVACVIRLVAVEIPSAEELGLPESVAELAYKKKGLVIVTGPTGCGKSTTLASLIDVINTNLNKHVITLEDPIEYLHRHKKSIVNQREIGIDSRSYSDALRAALREDPDVILVGEMRDLDTIATAITAAETGHLVLSTLHTTGAANT
ncbi:MAG: PilT/PilU family type 4a pilus ATPase, partial [Firmicutes bacterium]|nr:PilT/PilU family type 4a pilus ATPase [Bacillota bacterium]